MFKGLDQRLIVFTMDPAPDTTPDQGVEWNGDQGNLSYQILAAEQSHSLSPSTSLIRP
jgi:hypothetical protein